MTDSLISYLSSDFVQAVAVVILTALVGRLFTAKGRLIWSVSHQYHYSMPRIDEKGRFPVRTQQIWIRNYGRAPLEDIEILLNYPPQHLEIWAPREYETKTITDNRLIVKVPNLAGNEFFTISMLDTFGELPAILSVRSKSGLSTFFNMAPQIQFSPWIKYLIWALIIVGAGTILYFIITFLITLLTPIG
ncbi:hypothetical protein [Pseudophaeobacter arcticus]|jgi:hypothetical protein|uniref:hypothetical protein n=1 Tax=Pseudophaeobacter arcticus TaxID=385492 RepID=UPI0039E3F982